MALQQGKTSSGARMKSRGASAPSLEEHGLYRLGVSYGRAVYRFRWPVIAAWVVLLLASIPLASKLPSVLSGGGYSFENSDSIKAANILVDKLHYPQEQVFLVFHSADTPATDPVYQQEIAAVIAKVRTLPHVTGVIPGGAGKDGKTVLLLVNFNEDADAVTRQLPDIRKLLPTGNAASPASVYLTGDVAVYDELTQVVQQDTEKADASALPIALLVLLIVFGTLVAAVMPLALALVAVPVSLALVYLVAQHMTTNVSVLSIASIIGLGLSIDYSLFLIRRFREELAHGREVREAVAWTVATAGEAILFSGLTVIVGFCGMLLIGVQVMTSFGLGGIFVVVAAVLAALTLLPALLSVLGPRINALRVPLVGRLAQVGADKRAGGDGEEREEQEEQGDQRGFWHAWAMGVMRRPLLIIVLVAALLLGLGWPVLQMTIGTPSASVLPSNTQASQGLKLLQEQFPSAANDPIYIVVQTDDHSSLMSAQHLAQIAQLTNWLDAQPHITSVSSLTQPPAQPGAPVPTAAQLIALYTSGAYQQHPALAQFVAANAAGDTTLITATANTKLDSDAGKALIDHIRGAGPAQAQGMTMLVGGFQAVSLDFNRYLYGNFPKAIAFILIATFLLLLLMFRSLLLPLKAVLMNILSISAAYGVLVIVFQWGHLSGLLGFTPEGFIESTVPILLFCILFGLSMDYEVFLLSRIREEWLRTHNNRYAVAQGLEKTGGVITNAAIIFTIVTAAICFTTIITAKEMGIGMTVAVLVDATIIRSLLVPATMRLLGRWNWWLPGRPLPIERPAPDLASGTKAVSGEFR